MPGVSLREIPESVRLGLYCEIADSGQRLWFLTYTPPADSFARHRDPLRLVREMPGLRWFEVKAHSVMADTPDEGPNTCRLSLQLLLAAPDPTVPQDWASEGESVTLARVSLYDLCMVEGESQPEGWQDLARSAFELIEKKEGLSLWRLLAARLGAPGGASVQTSIARWMKCVLETEKPDQKLLSALATALASGKLELPETVVGTGEQSKVTSEGSDLRVHAALLVDAQVRLLTASSTPPLWPGRAHAAAKAMSRLFAAVGEADLVGRVRAALETVLATNAPSALLEVAAEALQRWKVPPRGPMPSAPPPPEREPSSPVPAARHEEMERQTLRLLKVEPGRIDALLGLVGELVVAKNSLPFLARRAEQEFGSRQLAREIKERYAVVNRIAEELQGAVMRVRMVPLAQVFRRFPRLVRDLSGKLGKDIRLEIVGDETEADKNIVEELFDPLVHLFRNSIDHGIELPDDRETAGKPREGCIRLSACYADDRVVIELQDDGRGIDVERVRQKAIEKKLATAQELASRTDEEIIQFIFAPGFSTVDTVSELSGRGVGMDVVRTMVTRAGGSISIDSKRGQSTVTRVTLPITMAVSRVMILEAGGTEIGIPFASITETVRVPRGNLKAMGDGLAIVLRGRLVPVWSLAKLLCLDARAEAGDEMVAVLVMRVDGEELGLIVDAFQETVDIIAKPLAGALAKLDLFSGTALLGDGRVLLVLDPKEVVRCL